MQIFDNITQGTEEWMKIRAWVITWTRLQSVIKTLWKNGEETETSRKKRYNLIYELIGEKIVPPRETYVSGAMERWHLVEGVIKTIYPDPIESVWFIKKNDWIGISPDWIIKNSEWVITRAVEIKAPEIKNTIKYWLTDEIPDEYFWQVVHYFVVIDTLESLDFIVANPDIWDDFFRMKKKTVTRKELAEYIEQANNDLADFYKDWTTVLNQLLNLKK